MTVTAAKERRTRNEKALCAVPAFHLCKVCAILYLPAGAGFIVVMTGDIMTLPGLPKVPSSEKIDVSDDGVISGLF